MNKVIRYNEIVQKGLCKVCNFALYTQISVNTLKGGVLSNKKKVFAAVVLSLVFAVLLTFAVSAETTGSWITNADGTYSYMDSDGELVKGVTGYWIGEDYYGFDANGIMYTGWVQPYKLSLGSSKEWRETWYFYGQNGQAPGYGYNAETGYLFSYSGQVMTDSYAYDYSTGSARIFVSDENGIATELTGEGWQWIDGRYYYIQVDEYGNKTLYSNGIYTIGETEYVFADGYMATNEWRWIEGDYVYADANGYPILEGWVLHEGEWYYIQNGSRLQGGVHTVGENKYYFEWDGSVRENQNVGFYDDNDDYCRGYASAGGALLCNQWRQVGNEWMYYDAACGIVENSACTIGDSVYCFDYEGYMVTNKMRYVSDYDCYFWFGGSGAGTAIGDGWFQSEDGWMFFEDGYYYNDCIANIEGTDYAFTYDGYLYDQEAWGEFYHNDEWNYYAINANGTINTTPGWAKAYGNWVWIENGVLKIGWHHDGTTWYYLDPYILKNETLYDGDATYYFFSDGRYINVTQDGFYRINAWSTCYFENGVPANGWRDIDGKWYYFDYSMYADDTYMIGDAMYYFDQDGVMQSGGWIDGGYDWYYADASGHLYTGVQTIGDTAYYFDSWGALVSGGRHYSGDVTYLTNDSGVIIAKSTDATGWYSDNGNYYYLDDGYFCYGDSYYPIGESYYAFDYDGVMIADQIHNGRYYKANGAMHTDGWILWNGDWYYTEEDHSGWLYSGLNIIDGKYYYFRDYKLVIGTFIYGNEIVTTDGSGAVVNIQPYTEGWNLINDNGHGMYYYVQNGELYTGWLGNYYLDPEMYCGDYYEIDGKYYYFYDNGVYAANTWIHSKYDEWMYAKADGSLYYNEWVLMGSTWYYFDYVHMLEDGQYEIDGEYHNFAENGAWLGKADETEESSYADGWHYIYDADSAYSIKEGWKYCQNGEFLFDTIRKIDGVWYGFDYHGYMITNSFNEYGYYMNSSGVVADYTGWQVIDGRWCYFTTENKVAQGWFTVNGTKYYGDSTYDSGGRMKAYIATGYKAIDRKLYNFAAGGACLGEVTTDGWYYVDGEWYYVQNGELVIGETIYINGVGYRFDYEGQMYSDRCMYDTDADRYVLYAANGARVTTEGWYYVDDEWLYVDADGYVLTGTHIIGGTSYYFDFHYYY